MRRILITLAVSAVVAVGIPALSRAADEELFDTKAAASYVEKGIDHLKKQKYDEAIADLEEAVSISPDAEGYYYLGYAYYLKGKAGNGESRKKALECFDRAYELDANFSPAKLGAAEAAPKPREKQPGGPEPAAQPSPEKPAPAAPADDLSVGKSQQDAPGQQPEQPVKATDKVEHIGNAPAAP